VNRYFISFHWYRDLAHVILFGSPLFGILFAWKLTALKIHPYFYYYLFTFLILKIRVPTMEAIMRAIEEIWIGEVAHLPTNNKECLPSDSRSRIGWHSFLVEFSQKLSLLWSPTPKLLYIRSLPLQGDAALVEEWLLLVMLVLVTTTPVLIV